MEFIKIPFGYLLDWLCQFTGSYGIALILFSLIIKVVLLPMSMKSKKSMLKMSRISPQLKVLEAKYGDDKAKYQQEVSKVYKEEGVSMFGGCLWSLIPLLIIIPLYYVIREPITYIMHFPAETAKQIVDVIAAQGVDLGKQTYYQQLVAASHLQEFIPQIQAAIPNINVGALQELNFNFLGLDLSAIPNWRIWEYRSLREVGMFLVPLASAGSQMLSMWLTQKMSNKVATNANGEQDESAAAVANQSNKTMMLLMPVMSLYFCFIMPAAISIYWIAQAIFGLVQDYVLTKHYRRIYEEEDKIKQERAAERAAQEAERERIRAERRAKLGEEGMVDPNTSKKKLKQKAEQKPAAPEDEAEDETAPEDDKHFSGDAERPFSRGRAYKPTRYGRKDDSASE